jgi:hypothetical protein
MDFPSQDWEFNDTAPPTISGDYTFELYAQLRATERILDNFRAVLGGSKMLYINASLTDMIPSNQFKGWSYKTQRHPRDLALRRNMLSTAWMDMPASLLFNNASIHDKKGNVVGNDTFMALLENLPESGPDTAAVRCCVVIGADPPTRPPVPVSPGRRGRPLRKSSVQRVSVIILRKATSLHCYKL